MRVNSIIQLLAFVVICFSALPAVAENAAKDESLEQSFLEPSPPPEYKGPKIKVNVAARQLKLYDHGDKLIKTYDVAVGSGRFPTPLGPREMDQIVWNPWWLPPKSDWAKNDKPTPPGPRNPLGPVKMRLGSAILVHGTNKPQSVGRAASHGCMRMLSEEVPELAWYIQQRNSSHSGVELRDQYAKHRGRSFYVQLDQKVPIEIEYEIAEVLDGQLHVYQDIYGRVRDKLSMIEGLLLEEGLDLKDLDLDPVKTQIRESKNREDLVFEVAELMPNLHDRERYLARVAKDKNKLASAMLESQTVN